MWFKAVWLGYYFDINKSPQVFTFADPIFAFLWAASVVSHKRLVLFRFFLRERGNVHPG